MKYPGKTFLFVTSIVGVFLFFSTAASQSRLTFRDLETALQVKLPNQSFKNKAELVTFLVQQVKSRKFDVPLTKDLEDRLRKVGATEVLIGTIRANSPEIPKVPETIVDLGELAGRAINLAKPEYLSDAQKAGISGAVTLELSLDEQGRVISTKTIAGLSGGLTEQAIDAAKKSTFTPATFNGKPAKAVGRLTYNFKLNRIDVAATLTAGDEFRKASNCTSAVVEYTKVINVDPKNARALMGRGICNVMTNGYEQAIADLNGSLRTSPSDDQAYYYLGIAYDFQGDVKLAARSYGQAVNLNSELDKLDLTNCIFIDRSQVPVNQLKTYGDSVVKACSASLQSSPKFLAGLLYLKRGIGYRLRTDFDRSISDLESARRIDPRSTAVQNQLQVSYSSRGNAHYNKKEYREAIDDVTTAININPQNPTPFVNRCIIYLEGLNDMDQAINDCGAAIRLSDRYSNAYYYRGRAYERKKDLTSAAADYKKAVDADPRNTKAQESLVRVQSPSLRKY